MLHCSWRREGLCSFTVRTSDGVIFWLTSSFLFCYKTRKNNNWISICLPNSMDWWRCLQTASRSSRRFQTTFLSAEFFPFDERMILGRMAYDWPTGDPLVSSPGYGLSFHGCVNYRGSTNESGSIEINPVSIKDGANTSGETVTSTTAASTAWRGFENRGFWGEHKYSNRTLTFRRWNDGVTRRKGFFGLLTCSWRLCSFVVLIYIKFMLIIRSARLVASLFFFFWNEKRARQAISLVKGSKDAKS